MAAPSAPTMLIIGSHKWGEDATAQVETPTSDAVTSVTAVISQTQGGAAIETVTTSTKAASYPRMEYWYLSWPTDSIASSPYYITLYATNSDGDGTPAEISTYLYFPPTVSITSPANGSTVTDSSVTLAWTATDDYGISWQRASVTHDGTELWGEEVNGTSIAIPSSVVFEDGESYTFSVTARNGKGMESTATSTVDFSFIAPTAPSLEITEGDGKSASITVTDSSYTESGTVLEASSSMMGSLTIDGLSQQDGTPTPSAPVPIRSVESRNVTTLFDNPLSDVYNASTNPDGYWAAAPSAAYSVLTDGWASFATNGTVTAQKDYGFNVKPLYGFGTSSELVTVLVELRNVTWSGTAPRFYCPYSPATTVINGQNFDLAADSEQRRMFTLTTKTGATYSELFRGMVRCYANSSASFQLRVSIYRGAGIPSFIPSDSVAVSCSNGKNVVTSEVVGAFFNASGQVLTTAGAQTVLAVVKRNTDYTLSYSGGNRCNIMGIDHDYLKVGDVGTPIFSSGSKVSPKTFNSGDNDFIACFVATSDAPASNIQLEIGDTATAYEPYSSTTTPIPVTLRSLPDGTHDEWVSGETEDTYIQRVGETMQAVTDGVTGTVGVDVLSSTGEIANGAQVLYKLATPVTTTLPHVTLPYVDGSAWVDAEVTPQIEATFRPVDFPDQPAADSVDVVRVNADGSTWTLASGSSIGDTVVDALPPLNVETVYKAIGKTSSGGMSEKTYRHVIESDGWVFNFGDAAQEHVALIYNPQVTMSLDQGGESYHFADGGLGGGLPVFYPTTDRDMSGTMKFDTVMYGDADVVLDLCNRYPVAWLRDPYGHRWMARVTPSASHDYGGAWPVSLSWSAVRFKEV